MREAVATATAGFFSRIRVFPTFLGLVDDALGPVSVSPASLGVEGVADGVSEQVQRHDQDEDPQHRRVEVKRVGVEVGHGLVDRLAPRRVAGHADAEEGQAGLGGHEGGQASEIETTIGATMLGSSSLNRIRRVGTPITRAAWTNSRSRSESTSPRISRARRHPAEQVETQIREITWAYFSTLGCSLNRSMMIGATARAISRNGSDKNTSMTNEMTRSSQPRLKPATRPIVMPIRVAKTVAMVAMISEVRAP